MSRQAVLLLSLILYSTGVYNGQSPSRLSSELSSDEFWTLSESLSEPPGAFKSDNLVTNELEYQKALPALSRHIQGGVYLGVGPEQNFTYIATVRPAVAFILDVRRGNRDLHLLYKALFELATDRAEFVSLLFARPLPAGLTGQATVGEIFAAVARTKARQLDFDRNLARVVQLLTSTHKLPLTKDEIDGIKYVYRSFFVYGPEINYASTEMRSNDPRRKNLGYAALMQRTDANHNQSSYMATEGSYQFVRDLQRRNLVIPVVGDFAGPKALRAIGRWIRDRNAVVSAFYVSNVEESYLQKNDRWRVFCANVASLPMSDASDIIRAYAGKPSERRQESAVLEAMTQYAKKCS